MFLPKNNLVAIAYKTGYCGSLIYILAALSPEVNRYKPLDQISFNDSTAHEYNENWFRGLHDYWNSLAVDQKNWDSYVPENTKQALLDDKLILFRCHPNTAYKLSFIENLRVLYLTHKNKYVPERWAYEKVYRYQGDKFYQQQLSKLINSPSTASVNNRVKRKLLVNNLNHVMISWKQLVAQMKIPPHQVEVDKLLEKNFDAYTNMCEYLNITPMSQDKFTELIDTYNSKQWKRF
jgi:hypothetical protein